MEPSATIRAESSGTPFAANPEKTSGKVTFEIPDDAALQAAVGRAALRHAQLDHALKYVIKTLTGVSILEALDATAFAGSKDLRERIKRLARKRLGDGTAFIRLQALIERCRRLTDRRNELIHRVWLRTTGGDYVVRGEDHLLNAPPTVQDLDRLTDDLRALANELSYERQHGFLGEALNKA